MRSFLRFLITFLVFLAAAFSALAVPERKVVIQAPADFTEAALEDLAARARARGVEVEIAAEGGNVQRGFDLLRLSTLPPSDRFRDAVLVFPVKIEGDQVLLLLPPQEQLNALLATDLHCVTACETAGPRLLIGEPELQPT